MLGSLFLCLPSLWLSPFLSRFIFSSSVFAWPILSPTWWGRFVQVFHVLWWGWHGFFALLSPLEQETRLSMRLSFRDYRPDLLPGTRQAARGTILRWTTDHQQRPPKSACLQVWDPNSQFNKGVEYNNPKPHDKMHLTHDTLCSFEAGWGIHLYDIITGK